MNVVVISGNLVRDVEKKTTSDGISIANGCVAINRKFSKNKECDFIDFTCFGSTADYIKKYSSKGMKVEIQGRLTSQNYENKNGDKRTKVFVVVDEINILTEKQQAKPKEESSIDDDDLPF